MAGSIPERVVVLTFDDGKRTDAEFVAPLLERYGSGATFFISEGLGAGDDKEYSPSSPRIHRATGVARRARYSLYSVCYECAIREPDDCE